MSVCHQATSLSIIPSVQYLTSPSVDMSVHHTTSLSVILSICHLTHPSVTPPVFPAIHLSDCPSLSDHSSAIFTSPSDCASLHDHLYDNSHSPSACMSSSSSLTETTTHLTACLSSNMIQCRQDSSHSLALMNWMQSCKDKKTHRAFTSYDLLLHALNVSCIYMGVSRCVAPPKSGEDAHVTCGMCDLSGPTLNQPRLGFSYILPRLWNPGGVRSTPNVPTMNLD